MEEGQALLEGSIDLHNLEMMALFSQRAPWVVHHLTSYVCLHLKPEEQRVETLVHSLAGMVGTRYFYHGASRVLADLQIPKKGTNYFV